MLFYDFEVFEYDWLVVVYDMINQTKHEIVNDKNSLEKLYQANKNNIWIGFNSRHYDQYIFQGILCGFNPKKINDYIIKEDNPGWKFSSLLKKFPLINYDVMLTTDRGLKSFEGFMGNNIKESSIPFDIKRKLTPHEIAETLKYCTHDVEQTIEIFLERQEEFNTMLYFIEHFNYPLSYISKTKSQLAAIILGGNSKGQTFDDEFDFPIVDCLKVNKYKSVVDWYRNPKNHDYKKYQLVKIHNVWHILAWGGIHGAKGTAVKLNNKGELIVDDKNSKPYHGKGIFLMIDVGGYYPSQQRRFGFGYRVMNNPENFEFIHDSNMEFKRLGDKKKRLPFKIMDNAISGQMKQKSSTLYDPMGNNSICVNGQLMLVDLIEHLEGCCELIQSNTDGLLVKIQSNADFDKIDDIVYEWECRTGLHMDIEVFVGEVFQKDVNNYLVVDRETGAVKTKGAYVKKLSRLDYDLPIVNAAITNYMINGISVEQTILECNNLLEFQQVKKIGGKYRYILYGDEVLKEKCIRCFASKRKSDKGLFKLHNEKDKPDKLEGTPDQCFIYNDSVKHARVPDYLDKEWYINLARKRLSDFGVC